MRTFGSRSRVWIVASIGILVAGCASVPVTPRMPTPPQPPRAQLQTIEAVVNTDPILNDYKKESTKDMRQKKLATLDFTEPGGVGAAGAGTQVADMLNISFFRKGLDVVERQNIQKILAEQEIVRQSRDLTEEERARLIGRIAKADYIVFGAVTEYIAADRDVQLGWFIPEKEKQRYSRELEAYQSEMANFSGQYQQYLQGVQSYNSAAAVWGVRGMAPQIFNPLKVPTLEEVEDMAIARPPRTQLARVANIGVTARVINVQTGKIVWIGQAAKRHLQLQEGLQVLTDKMVEAFLRE